MVYIRLDITFIFKKLSQYIKDSADFYIKAVKNLIQYIRLIIIYKIKYNKGVNPILLLHLNTD
jgi:hypothetical protein